MKIFLAMLFYFGTAALVSPQELSVARGFHIAKPWLVFSTSSIAAAYLDSISTIQIQDRYYHDYYRPAGAAESDPLARPFSTLPHPAYLATTGVLTLGLAAFSHHIRYGSNRFLRKVWWVPQAAQVGVNVGCFIHNEQQLSR